MDWGGALGIATLFVDEPGPRVPGVLLMLLGTTGMRYGRRGVAWGALATVLSAGLLLGAQVGLQESVSVAVAARRPLGWIILLGVSAGERATSLVLAVMRPGGWCLPFSTSPSAAWERHAWPRRWL